MTARDGLARLGRRLSAGAVLLILLWIAAAVPAVIDAAGLVRARTTMDRLGHPVDAVVVELQEERRLSTAYLAGSGPASLVAQRVRTDRAADALQAAAEGWQRWAFGDDASRSVDDMLRRLGDLDTIRVEVDARRVDRGRVLLAYTRIVDAGLAGAPWLLPTGIGLVALSRAREAFTQEDALLRGALGVPGGVTESDRVRLAELLAARRTRLSDAADRLPAADRDRYQRLMDDPRYVRLLAVEDQILLRPQPPVAPADWIAAADPIHTALRDVEVAAIQSAARATAGAVATIVYAGLIAGVGLVALVAVLARPRRSGATAAAPETATAAGPAAAVAERDDTGRHLHALLLDLHRRSQHLLHRQLRLLDGMERRESDDETLGDLFRADHLATRMRRNVEKAIMLAGGTPGRRWTKPVPIVDVVRGAASEVADYVRVSTAHIEPAGLTGAAVTDVTHLLAELIENATTYAPAETRVRVSGDRHDGGYTLTVADAGPGMSDDDLATAQQVMADPAPPGGGTWWGFYTLGRFAERQGITVRLYGGPAGGLVAEVELPGDLLADPEPDDPVRADPLLTDPLLTDPATAERPRVTAGPPTERLARMRARLYGADSPEVAQTTELPAVEAQWTTSRRVEAR